VLLQHACATAQQRYELATLCDGATALMLAAEWDRGDAIAALLQHACTTAEQRYALATQAGNGRQTPLIRVAVRGCPNAIAALLQHACTTAEQRYEPQRLTPSSRRR
jgi:ankyrin repeat protein